MDRAVPDQLVLLMVLRVARLPKPRLVRALVAVVAPVPPLLIGTVLRVTVIVPDVVTGEPDTDRLESEVVNATEVTVPPPPPDSEISLAGAHADPFHLAT
jgi:hypothetical protein